MDDNYATTAMRVRWAVLEATHTHYVASTVPHSGIGVTEAVLASGPQALKPAHLRNCFLEAVVCQVKELVRTRGVCRQKPLRKTTGPCFR